MKGVKLVATCLFASLGYCASIGNDFLIFGKREDAIGCNAACMEATNTINSNCEQYQDDSNYLSCICNISDEGFWNNVGSCACQGDPSESLSAESASMNYCMDVGLYESYYTYEGGDSDYTGFGNYDDITFEPSQSYYGASFFGESFVEASAYATDYYPAVTDLSIDETDSEIDSPIETGIGYPGYTRTLIASQAPEPLVYDHGNTGYGTGYGTASAFVSQAVQDEAQSGAYTSSGTQGNSVSSVVTSRTISSSASSSSSERSSTSSRETSSTSKTQSSTSASTSASTSTSTTANFAHSVSVGGSIFIILLGFL
ncbi:uncharacterized protein RJT21DRAFT_26991 [Scheffersomyces amazonensis]|uniref:uncharacterized protein n=1 Tax=Scheffersomyces amazonensis TaxID=1078765 RepID=UPI00315DDEC6